MAEEKEKSPVSVPCLGYETMSEFWELIHDLLGGTLAMRKAGQTWLPIETCESATAYDTRLGRSILYNGFRDTLNKLSNKPFTHPVRLTELPEELAYLEDDVDGNNKPLDVFIKEVLTNLIEYGIAHILVDHSEIEIEAGKQLTLADEKRLGVRVYLINISPKSLIGWQSEKISKSVELTQIRFKETVVEPNGDYGDIEANYINVYNKENFELHKQDSDNEDKYDRIAEKTYSFHKIPLVTIYANKTGFMTAEPPLIDLAWLNLSHWQSSSDQKNILRFSRFGLLFGRGLPDKIVKTGALDIGPSKAILTSEKEADLKYVEHTGKSIEAGAKDIEDTENKMRVLGNQPLMKVIPNTATAERIDESRTVSQLQSWIRALERGMKQVLTFACEWRKIQPNEDMDVNIYSDFEAMVIGNSDKDLLLKIRQAGEITRERFLKEEQRRGVFSLDMEAEEEARAAEAEDANDLKNLLPEDDLEQGTEDEDLELEPDDEE